MSPLEEALFRFLMDRRCVVEDPEYLDLCRSAQGREERLRSAPCRRSRPGPWRTSCWPCS